MKYTISYEYRINGKKFTSEFEVESGNAPALNDNSVMDAARKDSVRFYKSDDLVGITIVSIKPSC